MCAERRAHASRYARDWLPALEWKGIEFHLKSLERAKNSPPSCDTPYRAPSESRSGPGGQGPAAT